MKTIIIQPKDEEEFKLLEKMFERMQIKIQFLSDDEKEDYGLGILMENVKTGKKISKETIMNKLK